MLDELQAILASSQILREDMNGIPKSSKITKHEYHDPAWHLKDPRTRKWLIRCASCQKIGYRPDAPAKFFGRYHLVRYFEPLDLDETGLCKDCKEALNGE